MKTGNKKVRRYGWWKQADSLKLWQALYIAGTGENPDMIHRDVWFFEDENGISFLQNAVTEDCDFARPLKGLMHHLVFNGEDRAETEIELVRRARKAGELPLEREDPDCILLSEVQWEPFEVWAWSVGIRHTKERIEDWWRKPVLSILEFIALLQNENPEEPDFDPDMRNMDALAWFTDLERNDGTTVRVDALLENMRRAHEAGELKLLKETDDFITSRARTPELVNWFQRNNFEFPADIPAGVWEQADRQTALSGSEKAELNRLREFQRARWPEMMEALVSVCTNLPDKVTREKFEMELQRAAPKMLDDEVRQAWRALPGTRKHRGRPPRKGGKD